MAPTSRDPDSSDEPASSSAASTDECSVGAEGSPNRASEVEKLFREHNQSLLRFVQGRLGSVQEAREVVQEAYVRMLGLDEDKKSKVNFQKRFLFEIAGNLATDRLRHRTVEQRLDPLILFDELAPATDRLCAAEEELEIVERALKMLPANCLQALCLHRLDGLTFEKTAEQLNVNPRTARRLVQRAMEHCARELAKGVARPRKDSK